MSKIVSVHSYRGGTGKSNLTANLATILASQGHRVGMVDTDIQSPGIHVLFGYEETQLSPTLNNFLWDECKIAAAAHEVSPPLVKQNGGSLYLVPSSVKTSDITRILREGYDVGQLNEGFVELIEQLDLDYLFIDTHPGLNEETLLSITLSDVLVLILRPDRQDFQGTAVTVDVARKLDVAHLMLVVNKVLPAYDFAALTQQVSATYDAEVVGVLPLSEDMIKLGSGGIFSVNFPDHAWSQTVKGIAQRIRES